MNTKLNTAIFGSGKISTHLPKLFNFLDSDFIYCGKSYDFKFSDLFRPNKSDLNPNIQDMRNENIEIAYVILAVPDHQIQKCYEDLKDIFSFDVKFIHLSGALYFEHIIGLHPLMTFNAETQIDDDSKIEFFTDHKLFYSNYKNKAKYLNYIQPESKTIYHAMASMLGNFTQYYLYTLKNNFPEGVKFESYERLVMASVSSMFQKEEFKKLTGPFIRGDIETIEKHKCALKKDNPKLLEIYQNFENLFFEEIKS